MKHRLWPVLIVLCLILSVAAAGLYVGYRQGFIPAPLSVQDEDREKYQRPSDVLKALEISPGDWVADVGAGNGYYARHMADLVGPTGKVFGEDIDDHAVETMRKRVKGSDLRNVEVVKGAEDDPKLPENSLTAVLVMNAYHHFANPQAMLNHILLALKPGGRLVIGDYSNPVHRSQSRAYQLNIHEIDPELVQSEVVSAGFQVVERKNPFMKRMPDAKWGYRIRQSDMWLLVAVRPK